MEMSHSPLVSLSGNNISILELFGALQTRIGKKGGKEFIRSRTLEGMPTPKHPSTREVGAGESEV